MHLKNIAVLLLLPLALSACDSGQPTYSASNTASAPPPPQAQPQPQPQTPPPAPAPAPPPPTPVPVEQAPAPADSVLAAHAKRDHRGPPVPQIESFNVASCEDYIARYRTCMNGVLGRGTIRNADRFPLLRRLNGQIRQWRTEAKKGNTGALASQCAAADKEARPILHKAGCTSF
jgi:hypothetical protein